MDQSRKKKILIGVIGISLFTIGLILFIVGFTIKRPVVTFVNYDGTVLCEAPTAIGKTATYTGEKPTKPSDKVGYTNVFVGWEPSIEDVREDRTVTAVYESKIVNYTIDYELNGGKQPTNTTIKTNYNVNDSFTLPIPTKPLCTFEGWYTTIKFSGNPVSEIKVGTTGNKKFYAKWDVPTYQINYVLDGGKFDNNPVDSYAVDKAVTLSTPKCDGKIFGGWYTSNTFEEETKITATTAGVTSGDLTVYAKWLYQINYELDGGFVAKTDAKTYCSLFGLVLPEPHKIGYSFAGWYLNEELTGETVTEIEAGHIGDFTVYAKWERVNEGEVFVENGAEYIYFGHYAQTVVADANLITELNAVLDKQTNKAELNGETYFYVKATPADSVYRFSTAIKKGTSSSDLIEKDKGYFFKAEPIKWRVIKSSDGKLTLLSEYVLDNQVFDTKSNNYEESHIRKWLNETFLTGAFNAEELAKIVTTTVSNSASSTSTSSNKFACNDTLDKVFLLSYEEATSLAYGFRTSYDVEDPAKATFASDYAKALGIKITTSNALYGQTSWMLRSPFNVEKSISYVNGVKTSSTDKVNYIEKYASSIAKYGVRPVIVIEL